MSIDRVFVTGGSGFVGSAVVTELVRSGRSVAVLLREQSNVRRLRPVLDRVTVVHGELATATDLEAPLKQFRPQAVLHLAWSGVKGADRNSSMQPYNIIAAASLFRVAADTGCTYFLGLGSQAEYGPAAGKLNEQAPTHPTTLYGAAKLATYLILDRMAATSGTKFGWLRLFSSYGCDDDPSWLIPYLINTLLQGRRPSVTAAQQLWDFVHVEDVARAVISSMDALAAGIFNVGSGRAVPLRAVIETIRDLIDPDLPIGFGEQPYRSDQVMHLEADISALRVHAGWEPRVALERGLAQVVAWHRAQNVGERDAG